MSGIALDGLVKRYGSVTAVAGVSLAIRPGEFVTLLGPSGSGKTTTLRMIAGLEQPTEGTVRIGERTMSGPGVFVPVHQRRLGMVFQSYAVWPHMTVADNVAFPLRQQGVDKDAQRGRVERMLQLVGLEGYAARFPSQLSGGQQQRVALARALVAEPEVILFDEPLSNLDAQLRDSMRTLIRDLHRRLGLTAVYVTHDQVEAMALSDRIFVMHEGLLMQSGTPEDLYERPDSRFTAEFIGSANVLPVRAVDASAGTATLPDGTAVRCRAIAGAGAGGSGSGSGARAGDERVLVVRPHRVRIARADDGVNVLAGTVSAIAYFGDRLRIDVDVPGCGDLQVDAVPGTVDRPEPGSAIRLLLPPEACLVL